MNFNFYIRFKKNFYEGNWIELKNIENDTLFIIRVWLRLKELNVLYNLGYITEKKHLCFQPGVLKPVEFGLWVRFPLLTKF